MTALSSSFAPLATSNISWATFTQPTWSDVQTGTEYNISWETHGNDAPVSLGLFRYNQNVASGTVWGVSLIQNLLPSDRTYYLWIPDNDLVDGTYRLRLEQSGQNVATDLFNLFHPGNSTANGASASNASVITTTSFVEGPVGAAVTTITLKSALNATVPAAATSRTPSASATHAPKIQQSMAGKKGWEGVAGRLLLGAGVVFAAHCLNC